MVAHMAVVVFDGLFEVQTAAAEMGSGEAGDGGGIGAHKSTIHQARCQRGPLPYRNRNNHHHGCAMEGINAHVTNPLPAIARIPNAFKSLIGCLYAYLPM